LSSDKEKTLPVENYEVKLLSLMPNELPAPKGHIPFADLVSLTSIQSNDIYERGLRQLANNLPYQTSLWPAFGEYLEDWYRIEIGEFKRQLLYCERGHCDVRKDCENLIELSYHILGIVSPALTPAATKIAKSLDRIQDQRLLIGCV